MVTQVEIPKDDTTIRIKLDTKHRLDLLGAKNDTYDDIIKRLLDENDKP